MEKLKYGLYIVAMPIGNMEDITLRALRVLKECDSVIMEERKQGCSMLRALDIKKDFILLNEHNERESTKEIINRLLNEKEALALISDAGTPLFADPGNNLVWQCHQMNIPVIPIPGPSSIMASLMCSGLPLENFQYYGFLPPNRENRINAIRKLNNNIDLVFLEAPYRMKQVLRDMKMILGGKRQAMLFYKLTQPEEQIFWGNLDELITMTSELPKGEFVIILKKVQKRYKY